MKILYHQTENLVFLNHALQDGRGMCPMPVMSPHYWKKRFIFIPSHRYEPLKHICFYKVHYCPSGFSLPSSFFQNLNPFLYPPIF